MVLRSCVMQCSALLYGKNANEMSPLKVHLLLITSCYDSRELSLSALMRQRMRAVAASLEERSSLQRNERVSIWERNRVPAFHASLPVDIGLQTS